MSSKSKKGGREKGMEGGREGGKGAGWRERGNGLTKRRKR